MARYMKTGMPFYGVKKPQRMPILKALAARWPPGDLDGYLALVGALWKRPHREEKYLAIGVARSHRRFVVPGAMPLYRRLIVEGAWWDLVDEVASALVGTVLLEHREATTPTMLEWIGDDEPWLRRAAIISQLKHGEQTDTDLLFACCRTQAPEPDFFIRKAIGWALRQYARTDPEAVRRFVAEMGERLSPLSRREALKHL